MHHLNRILFSLGLFIVFSFSCYSQFNPRISRKIKHIKLNSFEAQSFFAYENSISIIYLDKYLLIKQIQKHLENRKLCDLRRKNYTKILSRLSNNDSSFFVIEPTMSPEELKLFGLPNIDTITGYKPLDYYASKIKKDISINYVPPYGFNIELDTIGKIHLEKYFIWMISDLVLKGNAKIYNKESKNFEKRIIFEIVSFEGHGGETLLFPKGTSFFDIDTYSDIVMPDFECGDDYEGYEIIE